LKITAAKAGGTNKLIHAKVLPINITNAVVNPALDHPNSKVFIDLSDWPYCSDPGYINCTAKSTGLAILKISPLIANNGNIVS
jgi:hypothetical protein